MSCDCEQRVWVYMWEYVLARSELDTQGTVCCVFMHAGGICDPAPVLGGADLFVYDVCGVDYSLFGGRANVCVWV